MGIKNIIIRVENMIISCKDPSQYHELFYYIKHYIISDIDTEIRVQKDKQIKEILNKIIIIAISIKNDVSPDNCTQYHDVNLIKKLENDAKQLEELKNKLIITISN